METKTEALAVVAAAGVAYSRLPGVVGAWGGGSLVGVERAALVVWEWESEELREPLAVVCLCGGRGWGC